MSKPLVGHHLMRVRIRKNIFDRLQDLAEEESERSGEHVTVSDIVRVACYNHLLIHDAVRQLEHAPPEDLDDDEEEDDDDEMIIFTSPMLR